MQKEQGPSRARTQQITLRTSFQAFRSRASLDRFLVQALQDLSLARDILDRFPAQASLDLSLARASLDPCPARALESFAYSPGRAPRQGPVTPVDQLVVEVAHHDNMHGFV